MKTDIQKQHCVTSYFVHCLICIWIHQKQDITCGAFPPACSLKHPAMINTFLTSLQRDQALCPARIVISEVLSHMFEPWSEESLSLKGFGDGWKSSFCMKYIHLTLLFITGSVSCNMRADMLCQQHLGHLSIASNSCFASSLYATFSE